MSTESDSERICWVCLESETEEGLSTEAWSRPCRCRGALKWVHSSCLQRWIDEKQVNSTYSIPVSCRACGASYEVSYPPPGYIFRVFEAVDLGTRNLSYYVFGGIILGSFYWSAVSYGALTVMQLWGHQQGLHAMEHTDGVALLMGLPTIPVCLVMAQAFTWENILRSVWRRWISRLRIVRWIFPKSNPTWRMREDAEAGVELQSIPRHLCTALLLPTIASLTGNILFHSVETTFKRTLLGGLAYVCVKGVLLASYREMQYTRACYRQVKDYEGDS